MKFDYISRIIGFVTILCSLMSCSSQKLDILSKIEKPNRGRLQNIWTKNLDPIYETGNLPITTGAPFIHAEMVYQGDQSGDFMAYDLETGRVVWEESDNQPINSQANIYEDQVVYGTSFGRLISRHYYTGEKKWAIDLGESIESQPIMFQGRIIIHVRDHRIVCLDAATGKIFWNYQRSIPFATTLQKVAKVLPLGNRLILGFADGYVVALSLEEGLSTWETKLNNGNRFIDVDNRAIYFDSSIVVSSTLSGVNYINPQNGQITKTIPLNSYISPLILEGGLLVGTINGEIVRLNIDGKEDFRRKISEDSISSMALLGKSQLSLTTMKGELLIIDRKSFAINHKRHLGSFSHSSVFSEIVSYENYLALLSSRNRLYIYKLL
ncbi:PQQ-binding-like beta-propeller repeat protein [Bacteriovoracaceae bacterium]|nr:PQQ-binding-like beta-propeller repeat protein [Bacteriovoracaceae bacterium]